MRVDTNLKAFEGPRGDVVQTPNWLYPSNQVQAGVVIRSVRCNARALSTVHRICSRELDDHWHSCHGEGEG
jgi:hypothetical protein